MPPQVGSRRSLIVSLVLVVAIAFGALAATLSLGWGPKLGLDLAGGLSVVYKPATPATTSDMQEVVTILTDRVDGLGVSGATVNLQGKDVVVSVPGVTHARAVLQAVGQTAQLLFRPVLCQAAVGAHPKSYGAKPLPACGAQYATTAANLNVNPSTGNSNQIQPDPAFATIKSTQPLYDNPKKEVILPQLGNSAVRYVLGPSELTGRAVKSAVAQQNQVGAWVVNYTLTSTGSPEWDKVAEKNFHALLAIELDGVVQSAPLIQPTQAAFSSFGGTGEISGSFTEASAKTLALAMNFGALPVRLDPLTTLTVSPTLGHSALVAGLGAGLAGLALVLLYTILYYRALGLVIVSGLAVTAALLWAIISALGHTAFAPSFDLAGVTGLIVSIGITVDSYIVYFERLKDEARAGRSVRSSVDRGFRSAWRTVLAADTVSLLCAVLLYIIAVGDVKGFAFFLGLSTLMDVFITWYFTRPLVILLGRRGSASNSALSMAAGLHAGALVSE
ncbi:MAG: protein-export rane protein SecD [Amycolatopsis sp.]|uniref:protein translocase subunit SecD n=1 Tax=Amycolatopsis sp. TaxID=37632 RepID=UPI0026237FEF|nr:protein translocase subunit SecD [Amycolatopsis sp.]MCU1680152.1 protein-export rane protein SecD [Amycolatopsis sp.]